MVSLLTPDVEDFIEEAKEKSVTAVTLLSNRKKLSRAWNFLSLARRVPYRITSSGQRSLVVLENPPGRKRRTFRLSPGGGDPPKSEDQPHAKQFASDWIGEIVTLLTRFDPRPALNELKSALALPALRAVVRLTIMLSKLDFRKFVAEEIEKWAKVKPE
jgi:hypothetical protein